MMLRNCTSSRKSLFEFFDVDRAWFIYGCLWNDNPVVLSRYHPQKEKKKKRKLFLIFNGKIETRGILVFVSLNIVKRQMAGFIVLQLKPPHCPFSPHMTFAIHLRTEEFSPSNPHDFFTSSSLVDRMHMTSRWLLKFCFYTNSFFFF